MALTCAELAQELGRRYGRGLHHAAELYRAVFCVGAVPHDVATQYPDLWLPAFEITNQHEDGNVLKFVSALADGRAIESVLIPSNGRTTFCVSSQVGCARACTFCVTGEMALIRNLSVHEIVWQVWAARFVLHRPVDNVVFMGMGEPMDNFDNVVQAIRVMSDQRGLNIACRHITLSTVGHVEGIRKLSALNLPNLRLAVSINAPTDAQRNELMPINRTYSLERLTQELRAYPLPKNSVIFVEYVLLAGVNDSRDDAAALARLLAGIPVRVNVIPWNGGATTVPYVSPTPQQVAQFGQWLIDESLFVRVRRPRGRGAMAACGQLGRSAAATISGARNSGVQRSQVS